MRCARHVSNRDKTRVTLREPAKLRGWLCGIARNLISNAPRRAGREPAHLAEPFDPAHVAVAIGFAMYAWRQHWRIRRHEPAAEPAPPRPRKHFITWVAVGTLVMADYGIHPMVRGGSMWDDKGRNERARALKLKP